MTASVHQLVGDARQRLRAAGIAGAEADLDARLLAQEVLAWDTARFLTSASEPAPDGFTATFETLVARRVAREPVAYIVGHLEFWNLEFVVSPDVLIPRPESEAIVDVGLERFPDSERPIRLVDVGTGSGCLAVALARERPRAHVAATDISPSALEVARYNIQRHAVADRVDLVHTDLLRGLDGPFDLIVSNPPYVPEGEIERLQPEVRDYEPAAALAAGPDGLAVIRRLLEQSVTRLGEGGLLVFEFGFGQAAEVGKLISAVPRLQLEELRPDLQEIPRVAVVRRV